MFRFSANPDNPQRDFYTIIGDTLPEEDETIFFELSASSGVTLLSGRRTAVVTILDDDCESFLLLLTHT